MAKWPYGTKRWQRLRLVHLAGEPFCRFCERVGAVTVATVVDHIVPVREAPERAFDQGNLQSLCRPCHDGPKRVMDCRNKPLKWDINGNPVGGWHE